MSKKKSEATKKKPKAGYELKSFVYKLAESAGIESESSEIFENVIEDWKTDEDWKDVLSCHGKVDGEEVFVVPLDQAELLAAGLLLDVAPGDFDKLYGSFCSKLTVTRPPAEPSKDHVLLEALVTDEVGNFKFNMSRESVLSQLLASRSSSDYLQDIITSVDEDNIDFEVHEKRRGELSNHLKLLYVPKIQSIGVEKFIKQILRGFPSESHEQIYKEAISKRDEDRTLAEQITYLNGSGDESVFAVLEENWVSFGDFLVDTYGKTVKRKAREEAKPDPEAAEEVIPVPDIKRDPPEEVSYVPKPTAPSQATPQAEPKTAAPYVQAVTELSSAIEKILKQREIRFNPRMVKNYLLEQRNSNPFLREMIFQRGEGIDKKHVVPNSQLKDLDDLLVHTYGHFRSNPKPVNPVQQIDQEVTRLHDAVSSILTKEKIGLDPDYVESDLMKQRPRNPLLKELVLLKGRGVGTKYLVPDKRLGDLRTLIVREYSGKSSEENSTNLLKFISEVFEEEGIKKNLSGIWYTIIQKRHKEKPLNNLLTYLKRGKDTDRFVVRPEHEMSVRRYLLYNYGSPEAVTLDDFVSKILRDHPELSSSEIDVLEKERRRIIRNLGKIRKRDPKFAEMISYCGREPRQSIYCVFSEDAANLQEYVLENIVELRKTRPHRVRSQQDNALEEDAKEVVKALKKVGSPTRERNIGERLSEGDDFEVELPEFVSGVIKSELMDASVGSIVFDLLKRRKENEGVLPTLITENNTKTHSFKYGVADDRSQALRQHIIDNYASKKLDLKGTTSFLDAFHTYVGIQSSDDERGMMQIITAAIGGNHFFSNFAIFPAIQDPDTWRIRPGQLKEFLLLLDEFDLPYHGGKIRPSDKAREIMYGEKDKKKTVYKGEKMDEVLDHEDEVSDDESFGHEDEEFEEY